MNRETLRTFYFMIAVPSLILDPVAILDGIASHTGHTSDTVVLFPYRPAIFHADAVHRAAGSTDPASDASVVRVELLCGHISVT